ncbi:MAG: hypothetical protein EBR09_12685 [Proteobacteria bacterium]|nr:hypothetical protein [Pseudomonadota bacterium]
MAANESREEGKTEPAGKAAELKSGTPQASELWALYQSRSSRFDGLRKFAGIIFTVLLLAALFTGLWIVVVR